MSTLKIITTYQCSAECDHCRFRCTTKPQQFIDHDSAMRCIQALRRVNQLELVVFLGGEPGLFPTELLRLVEETNVLGVCTRVETNACWAISEDTALRFLAPLARLNTEVMLSLDSFHLPYVPLTKLVTAVRVAQSLGMSWCVETAYENMDHPDSERDILTQSLILEVENQLGQPLLHHYKGSVLCVGRAADLGSQRDLVGRGVPDERCAAVPWWLDSGLDTLGLLYLDSMGYVSKGCGIAIGNVTNQPIEEIIAHYNVREHPILGVLFERGPIGLIEEASGMGFSPREHYADRCHLCQEVREALREKYPNLLTPDHHYRG